MNPNSLDRQASWTLAEEVRTGSDAAWVRLVDTYANLIHSVIGRYLPFSDVDDRRSLFVGILNTLRQGGLHGYDGRTRLSTWLFIFTRSRCLDWIRSRNGRRSAPRWLEDLPEPDRRVFHLYYVEGIGCREIRRILSSNGSPLGIDELAASLQRIEERLDPRVRNRLAYDLFAQSVGLTSGKLMDFLHRIQIEYEQKSEQNGTDRALARRELERTLRVVRDCVCRLPELERKVISLRYYEGRTARQTADALDIPNPRQIYTVEARAIRRLKELFEAPAPEPESREGA